MKYCAAITVERVVPSPPYQPSQHIIAGAIVPPVAPVPPVPHHQCLPMSAKLPRHLPIIIKSSSKAKG